MKPSITSLALRPAVASDLTTTAVVLLKIDAPRTAASARPSLNLGLSLDRSGSMTGEPILRLRQACSYLNESLRSDDLLSAATFESHVEVLGSARPVSHQASLFSAFGRLAASGGTDLYNGINASASEVYKARSQRQLDRVLLLTDGCPTAGIMEPERLIENVRKWKAKGVSLTAVGLGSHYNEDLLSALASAGGGNFFHIDQPDEIAPFFQLELQGLSRTYARDLRLNIETGRGVKLIRVLNILKRSEDGSLLLSDLVKGVPNEVVLELEVPPQHAVSDLARFHLSYTEVAAGYTESVSEVLRLPVVPSGRLSEFGLYPEVAQKRALQLAANFLREAVGKIDDNDRESARSAIERGLQVLGEATPCPEIDNYVQRLHSLKEKLSRNEVASARKLAHYGSVSISSSGLGDQPFFREFMALPESERTPERFQELVTRSLGH